jgi:short-subunit dehydrogenase
VIIIGAGPLLGRSLGLRCAREGLDVCLIARRPERLAQIAAEIRAHGGGVELVRGDASDPDSVVAAVEAAAERLPVEMLVYNASLAGGRISETDGDVLRQVGDVNLTTPVLAVRAALPSLQKQAGTVLLTGGGYAIHPDPEQGVLSVGKGVLRTVAQVLALDIGRLGVKVRTVTIAGVIRAGTAFDPGVIADAYWQAHVDGSEGFERIIDGGPTR